MSSRILGEPPGSFIEPPSKRTIPPSADIQSRKANDNRPEAILVTGRRTLEARPPAMWFRATSKKTIRPSDQSSSIKSIVESQSMPCLLQADDGGTLARKVRNSGM